MFQRFTKAVQNSVARVRGRGQQTTDDSRITSEKYIRYALTLDDPNLKRKKLLAIAGQFQKERKYFQASDILMELISATPMNQIDIQIYLTLSECLVSAKNTTAALQLLLSLDSKRTDPEDRLQIAAGIRDVYRKKTLFKEALIYDVVTYCRHVYKERKKPSPPDDKGSDITTLLDTENMSKRLLHSLQLAGAMQFRKILISQMSQYIKTNTTYSIPQIEKFVKDAIRSR